ncbi:DNA mismatch repair protein MutL [Gracilariopsis chorda]|uniref:DNA mismatch repair protein MutL n=1 Tax=Gracilariopsis chorda TaxID=448386 RepID=A0A2V3J6D9_9FLOR|nr:DNA mismatch repair protein MutL [Gracilariopsis chorda]|eukprot:PXF49969.1 DNA mismatch repair protein MutL [Gracilariopsis chorda]
MICWILPCASSYALRYRTAEHVRRASRRCFYARSRSKACLRNATVSVFKENIGSNSTQSSRVEILPFEVVQRIASGEVISGFESVVQELVENAIDARACKISVDIDLKNCAVTVEDDGIGISILNGFVDVAKCNATSKLRSLQQLENGVASLGFRGQGLWAIANTAKSLIISSRPAGEVHGTSVSFAGGGEAQMHSIVNTPMQTGTVVRALGLPWEHNEVQQRQLMRKCKEWIIHTALCHPQITFCLSRSGRQTWSTTAINKEHQQQRKRCLVSQFQAPMSDFRSASVSIANVGDISLVIGLPSSIHTSSRSWIVVAVNGRCVRIDGIKHAICDAVEVKRGRYPVIFVQLCTDPKNVNWNITPKKARLRFTDPAIELSFREACLVLIKKALRSSSLSTGVDGEISKDDIKQLRNWNSSKSLRNILREMHTSEEQHSTDGKESMSAALMKAKIVGQVLNTYILVEYKGGIMLIEQHVAEERAIYERLLASWRESQFCSPQNEVILSRFINDECLFSLTSLGIHTEPIYEGTSTSTAGYRVKTLPKILADRPSYELVPLLSGMGLENQTLKEAAASLSCKLAVKNGTALDDSQMKRIAGDLFNCDNPHTCPHGRPIFVDLEVRELAKLFGRSWTPEANSRETLKRTCTSTNKGPHDTSRITSGVLKE